MDINLLREAVTVFSFVSFLCIVAYAMSPANRERFEQAARLAVDDDEGVPAPASPGESGEPFRDASARP